MSIVIKAENISKQYRLGNIGTSTLRGDFQRWWYTLRGLPDPTLVIGQENILGSKSKVKGLSATTANSDDFVWALRDINFEVRQGEVLGIIGKNGAGKSTLLKLLSRVTAPTTGEIKVKGRVASLLEVGTGFHPDLTGRENIFLNGAILGMKKQEIRNKLDEIIDFAGVARYIDTPVKRYSSGMYVRLAFAVAAHLEPEILIVDEVLAVGDAEFQKKALGKMHDVSTNQGRTVLFVSHNMQSIKSLCNTAIVLDRGIIIKSGQVKPIVDFYLQESLLGTSEYIVPKNLRNDTAFVEKITICNNKNKPCMKIPLLEEFSVKVLIVIKEKIPHFILGLGFLTPELLPLHTTFSKPIDIESGIYEFCFTERTKYYTSGKYKIVIGISSRERSIQYIDDLVIIEFDEKFDKNVIINTNTGFILNPMEVDIKYIDNVDKF